MEEVLKANFKDLTFIEESHSYYVDGKKLPSVSSLIENFYIHFDSKKQALQYSERRGFQLEDVVNGWQGENDSANDNGTRTHLFGEDYSRFIYFQRGVRPKCTSKQMLGVINFWNDLPSHIVPVALELQMFSRELGYCGTTDILLYDTIKDYFIIADYKTNKEMFDEDERYPSDPLLFIPKELGLLQNNFGKYSLQLSFYQILLEQIGLQVKSRWIIWLNEDKPNKRLYKLYKTLNVTKSLREWLPTQL